ncbi:MAG: HAD-IB family phosphatase, partial [Candidatus Thermoplasmatota archaeon]|nr:HAD-IB family phosphatase [Candidatus Thermoplasmatota archaeon]
MDVDSCIRYCFRQSREPLPEKPKRDHHIKLVLFDMDGVLVDSISSWKHIHTFFSTNNDHSVDAYVKGLITDEEFIRQDVSQWKKDNEFIFLEELHDIFSSLSLMDGARTCVNCLKKNGVMLGIVSAGIDLLANQVASELGITMVYANQLK